MILCMQKEKPAIFTLSRQQKITPNCDGGVGGGGGGGLRRGEGGGFCWEAGRPASRRGFFLPLHMCESGPPGTA